MGECAENGYIYQEFSERYVIIIHLTHPNLPPSLYFTYAHTRPLLLSLLLSHTHTLAHSLSLSHSHSLSHTHSLYPSLSLSLSLPLSLAHIHTNHNIVYHIQVDLILCDLGFVQAVVVLSFMNPNKINYRRNNCHLFYSLWGIWWPVYIALHAIKNLWYYRQQ